MIKPKNQCYKVYLKDSYNISRLTDAFHILTLNYAIIENTFICKSQRMDYKDFVVPLDFENAPGFREMSSQFHFTLF